MDAFPASILSLFFSPFQFHPSNIEYTEGESNAVNIDGLPVEVC
jgi:hypothetical protein